MNSFKGNNSPHSESLEVVGLTEMRWHALTITVLLLASARLAAAQTITEFPIPIPADSIVAGSDGALWFATRDRNYKKIGRITTAGAVTEFSLPVPAAERAYVFTNLAAGPDGALWFGVAHHMSESPDRRFIRFGRITTTGEVTEFPLPSPFHVFFGITAGPDCALWFTESNDHAIGRITTTGGIAEFSLPWPTRAEIAVSPLPWLFRKSPGILNSYFGITTGPDGALWFADLYGSEIGQIGRITTAGAASKFSLPPERPPSRSNSITRDGDGVYEITAGPDGALWFTETFGRKIGRITTAGAVTEFTIPAPARHVWNGPWQTRPWGITPGPDGALWFADTDGNKIGRITTTGELSEVLLPTPNSFPGEITAGPDGALWFTELANTGGKIGRIAPIEQKITKDLHEDIGEDAHSCSGIASNQYRRALEAPHT
jgi:virginiamycin B lyase